PIRPQWDYFPKPMCLGCPSFIFGICYKIYIYSLYFYSRFNICSTFVFIIIYMIAIIVTNFKFNNQTAFYRGKVRDVYSIGNNYLVMVASDRISAFDVVLPRPIPHKGQVLNQIAAKFLQATADIIPNWVISVPDPNATIGRRCEPFK